MTDTTPKIAPPLNPAEALRDIAIEISKETGFPVDHDGFDAIEKKWNEPMPPIEPIAAKHPPVSGERRTAWWAAGWRGDRG